MLTFFNRYDTKKDIQSKYVPDRAYAILVYITLMEMDVSVQ